MSRFGDFKTAIVIPTWNGARLGETLANLPRSATQEVVSTRDRGWPLARAWNYGAEKYLAMGYDAVIISNDDLVMRPDTDQQLAWALLVHQFEDNYPSDWDELLLTTEYNLRDHPDEGPRWGYGCPDYSCFCIGQKYLDVVGPFDENFHPAYLEDNDSHTRIKLAGFQGAQWAPVYHYGSTTVRTDKERAGELWEHGKFEANRAYYRSKWGGFQHEEVFSEPFNGNPPEGWRLRW